LITKLRVQYHQSERRVLVLQNRIAELTTKNGIEIEPVVKDDFLQIIDSNHDQGFQTFPEGTFEVSD
jgi:hypothetical protein